jgi:hypothetical protein
MGMGLPQSMGLLGPSRRQELAAMTALSILLPWQAVGRLPESLLRLQQERVSVAGRPVFLSRSAPGKACFRRSRPRPLGYPLLSNQDCRHRNCLGPPVVSAQVRYSHAAVACLEH